MGSQALFGFNRARMKFGVVVLVLWSVVGGGDAGRLKPASDVDLRDGRVSRHPGQAGSPCWPSTISKVRHATRRGPRGETLARRGRLVLPAMIGKLLQVKSGIASGMVEAATKHT